MRINKALIPLLLILVVASVVRFYKLSDQSFTHDEFSTLFRLEYNNLNDVIQIGMKEQDNHPIGTQVFYYYYTKIFGKDEKAVKFPTIIFGIFSVFMVYLIGKKWFNSTSALYAASFMAVLQYAVAQSQIARMYGFGIPFVLLMVYYWDKLLNDGVRWRPAIFYVLSAAMCAYTHYFSLLFVVIAWTTGAFMIDRKQFKYYFLCGLAIFILFVPHLGIFFFQLSKGGIEGWLGAFRFSYFFTYISYLFHHSYFVGLAVLIPILVFFNTKYKKAKYNYRYIALVWFFTPIIIGFIYSYFVNNVMHEKVLYFTFPFLLLFLASFIKSVSLKKELLLVVSILMVGVASLVLERNHFNFFNNHRYKFVANRLIDWTKDYESSNLLALKITHERIDSCYNSKRNFDGSSTIYFDPSNGIAEFIDIMEKSTQEYLYFGRAEVATPTYMSIALNYFPDIIKREYTVSGEAFLLKKGDVKNNWPSTFWNYSKEYYNSSKEAMDSNTTKVENGEFFGGIELLLDTIIFSHNNFINIELNIKQLDSIGGAMIVSSMEKDGKNIDWRSSEISEFILVDSLFNKVIFSVPIYDIRIQKHTLVKFLIWNPKKGSYLLKDFKISTYPGNPFIYGKTNKIPYNKELYCLTNYNI